MDIDKKGRCFMVELIRLIVVAGGRKAELKKLFGKSDRRELTITNKDSKIAIGAIGMFVEVGEKITFGFILVDESEWEEPSSLKAKVAAGIDCFGPYFKNATKERGIEASRGIFLDGR